MKTLIHTAAVFGLAILSIQSASAATKTTAEDIQQMKKYFPAGTYQGLDDGKRCHIEVKATATEYTIYIMVEGAKGWTPKFSTQVGAWLSSKGRVGSFGHTYYLEDGMNTQGLTFGYHPGLEDKRQADIYMNLLNRESKGSCTVDFDKL